MRVFVGMSGGVDSSVTAALLKDQGYKVTGVYMKNWTQDIGGFECPWREDFEDAKRTAARLKLDFEVFDFQKEYKQKVVDYMINEYRVGHTPNPDVMCNQEVKFKLFLETALEKGADLIATGHYARLKPLVASSAGSAKPNTLRSSRRTAVSEPSVLTHRTDQYGSFGSSAHPGISSEPEASGAVGLFMAGDRAKDQTYFLYRVNSEALNKTLFPIGDFKTKEEVRKLAKKFNLPTADKKDSQGICFVGEVGIKDFLSEYVKTEPGPIINQQGHEIGSHEGAIFYTIGQRHGLNVGGGLPYYVTKKDMKKNIVYVTTDLSDKNLWSKNIKLKEIHWINQQPTANNQKLKVRLRYRGPLVGCSIKNGSLTLAEEQRAISVGQSAVIYEGEQTLGGGIIA